MVRAILEDRKSMTRRVIRPQPTRIDRDMEGQWSWPTPRGIGECVWTHQAKDPISACYCPYGMPGDRLWVRETSSAERYGGLWGAFDHAEVCVEYAAGGGAEYRMLVGRDKAAFVPWRNRPSIHMPRWASRLTLEVREVRVERVQEIFREDCIDEGIDVDGGDDQHRNRTARENYRELWDTINAKRGYPWESNPWVWVVRFEKEPTP
jgi:hypothetical protein